MTARARPDITLSTMWAFGRFSSLADFFQAGRALGFERFELNHGVESHMLAGLSLDGAIAAVHEPCPADIPPMELKRRNWLISATGEEERRQGVLATQRSVDLAHALGARLVVVHPGRVDIDPTLELALVRLHREGQAGGREYLQARQRLVAERAARAGANMRSVRRSLLELAEHAAALGVRLGLENRYHYDEIPQPDELDELLDLGCGDSVGYWHDVGHAQVQEHLGLGSHEAWLRRFASRMAGIHLHDAVGLTDHMAAGLGEVDWDLVFRHVPAGALRTCEFHASNTPEQVAAARVWLLDREGEGNTDARPI